MTPNGGWIEDVLVRIQGAFLDNPALSLTVAQAQRRFRADAAACEAILAALLDAGVLAKTPEGAYVRFYPRFASETNRVLARTGDTSVKLHRSAA
jgi:hypothetical protein